MPTHEPVAANEVVTFCRVCEPHCGLVATVVDGHVTAVRGDKDNPFSQGFVCTKAAAMVEVTDDPERVVRPMRRTGAPGEFEPVGWDEALDDIATRLTEIVDRHGPDSFATFFGNPPAFNGASLIWSDGFQQTIGSKWKYAVSGEDAASAIAAGALMFGSAALLVKPDLWRTKFLVVIGANPYVSHGSMVTEPRFRQALGSIIDRGGRVVVIDPRRTETARHFEHVAPIPGTDPWLMLGMLRAIVDADLLDKAFVAEHASGADRLIAALQAFDVERCSRRCGLDAATIRELAEAFASAESACVYGRTGTCTQRFGTLANFLQNALNIVTGNLEVAGGSVFGWGIIDFARFAQLSGMDTYDTFRTRVRGLPEVSGLLPSQGFAEDITTPGEGKIRALLSFGANPVLTSGAGGRVLEEALDELELHFSLDLYINETNKHADYVLPATTFYERADIPLVALGNMLRPAVFATDAVVPPRGEAREEWSVLNDIARRMGRGGAYSVAPLRWLAKRGIVVTPRLMYDLLIRTSSHGDWFGLRRRGLSTRKLLERTPHGVQLHETLPLRPLRKILKTKDRRCNLGPPEIIDELARLQELDDPPDFPMRAIGVREIRSHNSWMHNVARLVPDGRTPEAQIHPDDAASAGIEDGGTVHIESRTGSISMAVSVTDDVRPGTVAIPHGWGHNGGWSRANRAGGGASNDLASSDLADIERLAGMSVLNGIPIRITAGSATSVTAASMTFSKASPMIYSRRTTTADTELHEDPLEVLRRERSDPDGR